MDNTQPTVDPPSLPYVELILPIHGQMNTIAMQMFLEQVAWMNRQIDPADPSVELNAHSTKGIIGEKTSIRYRVSCRQLQKAQAAEFIRGAESVSPGAMTGESQDVPPPKTDQPRYVVRPCDRFFGVFDTTTGQPAEDPDGSVVPAYNYRHTAETHAARLNGDTA